MLPQYHITTPLSLDHLHEMVPSAFATAAHESRSDRYTYIPTSDVINGLMKEGFLPFAAKQGNSKIKGKSDFTKHMIRFRHENSMTNSKGDSLPEVVLINSHDGTSTYQLLSGLFRLVCLNGMVVPETRSSCIRVPHKGNIVDDVIEGSFKVLEESNNIIETANLWREIELKPREQLLLAKTAHRIRFEDADGTLDTPIKPEQLLIPRRQDDVGDSLWLTHNRIQENITKGGLSGIRHEIGHRHRRVTTRNVNNIDQDVRLNRSLWELSSQLAQWKQTA